MPVYEYRCTRTGKTFDALLRRAEDVPACPHCPAPGNDYPDHLQRTVSAPAFHLKGTGWFRPGASR